MNLADTKEPRRSGQSVRLRDAISPNHYLVIAKELFLGAALENQCPQGISQPAFLLGLFGEKLDWTSDWSEIQDCFRTNAYWQYFCGYEYFSDRVPEGMDRFLKIRPHLKKTQPWKKAQTEMAKAVKKARGIANADAPVPRIIFERDLRPGFRSLPRETMPVEIAVPWLTGNRLWTLLAELFKKASWSTTFIGSDDVVMAQKSLYGPLMRFIPGSDKQACKRARTGQGDFADVVVEESTDYAPGKITYLSPGPTNPNGRLEAAISCVNSLDEVFGEGGHSNALLRGSFAGLPGHAVS